MKIFFTVILLLAGAISYSQEVNPIVTEEQNTRWLQEVTDLNLQEKLQRIKERWTADTAVTYYPTAIPQQKALKTNFRPLYMIVHGRDKIIFPSNPSEREITEVSKMLIPEKISEIQVETDPTKAALYGTRGSNGGVIFLKTNDDLLLAEIKAAVLRK